MPVAEDPLINIRKISAKLKFSISLYRIIPKLEMTYLDSKTGLYKPITWYFKNFLRFPSHLSTPSPFCIREGKYHKRDLEQGGNIKSIKQHEFFFQIIMSIIGHLSALPLIALRFWLGVWFRIHFEYYSPVFRFTRSCHYWMKIYFIKM